MQQLLVIFGSMDFKDDTCLINHVEFYLMLPYSQEHEKVETICENVGYLLKYRDYVIPEWFAGEILFKQ